MRLAEKLDWKGLNPPLLETAKHHSSILFYLFIYLFVYLFYIYFFAVTHQPYFM
jgi:hypothetical protein